MKIASLSLIGASAAKNTIAAQSLVKVCMHVRGATRADGRVMREATTLAEVGFAVSIVDVERERLWPVEEDFSNVHVKHVFLISSFIASHFKPWILTKAIQSHIYSVYLLIQVSADIYHAHDTSALPACFIAARLRRKPLIFDAHELPLSGLKGSRLDRFSKLLAHLLTFIIPRCAGVITVSPPIAQEIRKRYHIPEVLLIRNVPVYQTVAQSDRLRQSLELAPEVRIALYQGNLQPDRGLDGLISAAKFLERDIVVVMMGRGIGTTLSLLEALIYSEGVAERVKVIPPVPYTELLSWSASADIGLIAYSPDHSLNVRMCLPNKLFEYLMAGLPVLASPLDAVANIIRMYDVGRIVDSLEPEEIGQAISAMLADRDAMARMRHNALVASQRNLCWEKERGKLVQLYQSIFNHSVECTMSSVEGSRIL